MQVNMQPLSASTSVFAMETQRRPSLSERSRNPQEARQQPKQEQIEEQQQQEYQRRQTCKVGLDAIQSKLFTKGDRIQVFSASKNLWMLDGIVIDVLNVDAEDDGFALLNGSVKVSFDGGLATKWVPAQMVGTQLREWPRYPCTELQAEHLPLQQSLVIFDDDLATVLADSDRGSETTASPADSDNESQNLLVYVCPACEAKFQTSERFSSHWSDNHAPPLVNSSPCCPSLTNASSAEDDANACQTPPFPNASHGPVQLVEFVEFDAEGQLTTEWQEDPQTDDDNFRTVMPVSERGSDYSASPAYSENHTHSIFFYVCPTCEAKFRTSEDASTHWVDNHAPALLSLSAHCSCESNHTSEENAEAREAPTLADASQAPVQPVQCIECDAKGQPTIVRQEDPQTGALRTIVFNEDGSQRVFGEKTVTSLADSDEAEVHAWIGHMTDRHLKGLVHEVTDRVCKGSGDYHRRKDDLENRRQQRHYRFFGLSVGASQKDLDSVYRRLARSMHPDKNGGTEHAKEMFQTMKHKYEVLKAQIAKPLGSDVIAQQQQHQQHQQQQQQQQQQRQPKQPKQPEQADDREQQQYFQRQQQQEDNRDDAHKPEQTQEHEHQHQPQLLLDNERPQNEDVEIGCIAGDMPTEAETHRREAYDEDECHKQSSDSLVYVINTNTNDRAELEKVAWQMLQQLRAIRIGMVTLDSDFQLLEREDDCVVEAR